MVFWGAERNRVCPAGAPPECWVLLLGLGDSRAGFAQGCQEGGERRAGEMPLRGARRLHHWSPSGDMVTTQDETQCQHSHRVTRSHKAGREAWRPQCVSRQSSGTVAEILELRLAKMTKRPGLPGEGGESKRGPARLPPKWPRISSGSLPAEEAENQGGLPGERSANIGNPRSSRRWTAVLRISPEENEVP